MFVLTVEALAKSYGRTQALRGVSFGVPQQGVFGILGPNGSGKTTLLGIVLGILQPSAGGFRWHGTPTLGTLLETPNFYPYLSAPANLEITAAIRGRGREDIARVLDEVSLTEAGQRPFQSFSLGMKQRLAIAAALLGEPDVIVLDEPTNGLDPAGIAEVRQVLRDLAARGRCVILASHLLAEVEQVCTDLAILKQGQLLASGSLQEVLRNEPILELHADNLGRLEEILKPFPGRIERKGELLLLLGDHDPRAVNRHCFEQGVELSHLVLKRPTLEERFLELTE